MVRRYGRDTSDSITNFYLEASRGRITHTSTIHKFGNAEAVDTGDVPATIWDGTCDTLGSTKVPAYTYSTSADIVDIASGDDGDTVDIEVHGLDTNWDLVVQTVTLTGQTVATLSTPLIRVFRMINVGSTDLAGTVYLTTTGAARTLGVPDVTTTIRAIIKNGDNQTQMAIYTVPAGYTMYIVHAWTSLSRFGAASPVGAQIRIKRRPFGGVFLVNHTLNLASNGGSLDHRPYDVPIPFPEKTDIEYVVSEVSANDIGVSAGFHAILIEESN